jgi:hypothetical protein
LKLHPLDWNFSSCPPTELPILYCYEFSRESVYLREAVDYLRHGRPAGLTYWSSIPDFGWPEWPKSPILLIPPAERRRRIAQLLVPNPITDIVCALAEQPPDSSLFSRQLAIARHVREQSTPTAKASPRNRSAVAARYRDQLRALSVYRLRRHYRAREVMGLLREHFRKAAYNDTSSLYKAAKRARQHLAAFVLRAHSQLDKGQWFPPFGPCLIEP